jgi:hypothetical protein
MHKVVPNERGVIGGDRTECICYRLAYNAIFLKTIHFSSTFINVQAQHHKRQM